MKFLSSIFTVIILFSGLNLSAQLDRSVRPEAGPAPEIKIGESQTFELDNGLKVILVENHKVPRVSFQLFLDNDPILEKEAAGYLSAAGDLMRTGTKNRSKQEIDEAIDYLGASLSTNSNGFYGSTMSKFTEDFLKIAADVALNPTFPEEELEKYKKQTKSGLSTQKSDPAAMARNVAKAMRYGKEHPYGEITTEESVDQITRQMCMDYYNTYFKPDNAYMVVVGDIKKRQAKKLVKNYFGDWKKGDVPTHEYDQPKPPKGNQVAIANKDGAVQSVIKITYPIDLKPGDKDAIPATVMNEALGGGVFSGRLMQNLREDKGYTYGARSQLSKDDLVGYFNAGAEVGTEVTDSAIHEFLKEMQGMTKNPVTEEHLNMIKNVQTGSFARAMESPRTIARFALNTERYDLPADYYNTYLKKLNAVTTDQVTAMAEKYIKPENSHIVVAGDKAVLKKSLKKFDSDAEVKIYDAWGNEVDDNKTIPEGLTAEKVVAAYVDARGGATRLKAIKSVKQVAEMQMQGRTIETIMIQEAPNKMINETKMNGMLVSKQVYDGEKGFMTGMQGEKDFEGEDLQALKLESQMHKSLKYDDLGYELELVALEDVDGKEAYKVKVTSPAGSTHFDYYDVDSGLKIMTKKTIETQRGEMEQVQQMKDYKPVGGVLYPHTIVSSGMMPQPMEIKVKSIDVNVDIDDEMYKK